MNLQYLLLEDKCFTEGQKINSRLERLAEVLKKEKIKFSAKSSVIGKMKYYKNCIPIIPTHRDVLKKSMDICTLRVNWKNEDFSNLSTSEICKVLPIQYGFNIAVVDKEHTRNNYNHKENIWVVFDNKNTAAKYLRLFNQMFITAIELDCIEEYKKFKQNPAKRPLTYDKLVDNAYDLYDLVDNGEI